MLIFRRTNCINAASVIVTLLGDCSVHRLLIGQHGLNLLNTTTSKIFEKVIMNEIQI